MASDDIGNNPLLSGPTYAEHGTQPRHASAEGEAARLKAQAEGRESPVAESLLEAAKAQLGKTYDPSYTTESNSSLYQAAAQAADAGLASKPQEAESILQEADRIINGQRREDYGDEKESFGRLAGLFSAYLGMPVSPNDVVVLMVLVKASRAKQGYHRDSFVDIAGYAALSERLT